MAARVIGRGVVALEISAEPSGGPLTISEVRYSIESSGLKFFTPVSSGQPKRWFDVLPMLTDGQSVAVAAGHLSLVSLPASPQPVFYNVSFSTSVDAVRLHVLHDEPFAQRGGTVFKGLDITFTEMKTSDALRVEGQVILSLLGQDIVLSPTLTPEGGLVFRPSASQTKFLEIPELGQLIIETLDVGVDDDRWSDLQALYTFDNPTGDVFLDSAGRQTPDGSAPMAIDLKRVGKVTRVQGGVALCDRAVLRSTSSVSQLIKACKTSNAITISAWVKPTQKLTQRDRRPAQIVSLSKDCGTRNVTLGQDIDDENNNRYIGWLRRHENHWEQFPFIDWVLQIVIVAIAFVLAWLGKILPSLNFSSIGMPPLVSTPLTLNHLSHIVFTRDGTAKEDAGKIYIDGVDQTDAMPSTDLIGDFSRWSDSDECSLFLGNDATGDRPWKGEIHQVAIYSRALSPAEVERNDFPTIQLTGTLTLRSVPAPLDSPLPVTLSPDYQLQVSQQGLRVTQFLVFDAVDLIWHKPSAAIELRSGRVTATLWENGLEFEVALTADALVLSRPNAQRKSLSLKDSAVSPLGHIDLTQLRLKADRTATNPAWAFETDGQVTFTIVPPPLKGPFPVEIFLDGGKLWFSVNPRTSLALVEMLAFEQADLRFVCDRQGWQVQPDMRNEHHGITIQLFGQTLPLAAQFLTTDTAKVLTLDWSGAANSSTRTVSDPLGHLSLLTFSLKANPVDEGLRWQLFMVGQVPLGRLDQSLPGAVLDFRTEAGQIWADPENAQLPTWLQGQSVLLSLDDTIFGGDLQILDDRFLLNGRFDLFPNWSALQVEGDAQIVISPNGMMTAQAPVEVDLTDFDLLDARLALANGDLILSGLWLGETVTFTALHRAGQSVWEGSVELAMPFSLTLGPLYDPRSTVKLADRVQICQTPGCRQPMRAMLVIELSSAGFLARVNGSFVWQDATLAEQAVTLEAFPIFAPPATRNILLGFMIEQVKAHADELFGPRFRLVYGYFLAMGAPAQTTMYLGDRTAAFDRALPPTVLPKVFKTENSKTVEVSAFKLTQTVADGCKLTLNPQGKTQEDLKIGYLAFLQALEAQNDLWPGAATLIKNRIAERLPIALDRLLFYYYGLDPAKSQVDLQAGMRLRVDYQNYQFVHPADGTANSGFVGSGTSYYHLNSAGNETDNAMLLNFDAFLAQIQPLVSTDIATVGAGGGLDTFKPGYQKPYLRLMYPGKAIASAGSRAIEQTAMLVGASTLADLDNQENLMTFYFRGRATVIPEIAVMFQGQPVFVPVGTTLLQLMAQTGSAPFRSGKTVSGEGLLTSVGRLRLSRLVHEGVANQPNYEFIDLKSDLPVFDLPLVKGDRIVLLGA